MPIPTNKAGILVAEIDSGGALRSAGDRVILGSRKSSSEREWIVRQKIAQCAERTVGCVHKRQGIVARKAAESLFCTFPNPATALSAACDIQRIQTRESERALNEETTSGAPIAVRVGAAYGPMVVDGGNVSGDTIYVASQLAGRAGSGQIYAGESLINALGDLAERLRLKNLGGMTFDDLQAEVECFEVLWAEMAEDVFSSSPVAEPKEAAAPKLKIQTRGREILLDAEHRSVTLRSGKAKEPHARLEFRGDDGFFLVNLRTEGTRVKANGEEEQLCLDEFSLDGEGFISLGSELREGSPEVLKYARLS